MLDRKGFVTITTMPAEVERAGRSSNANSVPVPLVRPTTLSQAAYDVLSEMIINRSLLAGQHLTEQQLAVHLGISRQPVREALQRLQADGWVDLRPRRGAFVHTPTELEVDQLLAVRTLLESESARLAAGSATEGHVQRLWDLWRAGLDALANGDTNVLVTANTDLHAFVVSMSGNAVLAEFNAFAARRIRWYYAPLAQVRGEQAWDEHAELIRAIAAGDGGQAYEVMRKHTERTRAMWQPQPTELLAE